MTSPITPRLAEFASSPVTPSAAAQQVVRLSALDWIAVGRAGRDEPVARIVREMVESEAGSPEAALFGSALSVPARSAALVNGTVSHALDYDDTHFAHIGHPSVAIFPAALAVGERAGCSLAQVIEAALMGMELSIRVGLWFGRDHYQRGFHQTATAGAFGAAAAAGRLLGLSVEQMAHCLGLVATRAAGLKAQFGTMGKPYNAGIAAQAGAEAAVLIERGFVANSEALEGDYGFGATHHGMGEPDALVGLGEDWLFESVSHKFHACCHGLHAALEAARALDLAAPEIAQLTVTTHPRWMSVCNQTRPSTGLGAKFSYGTVLAMTALGHDTARLDSYSDALCADPRLVALRDLVVVREDATISETGCHLELLRRDGQRLTAQHDLSDPMSLPLREDRVRSKATSLIGGEAVVRITQTMANPEARAQDLAALLN